MSGQYASSELTGNGAAPVGLVAVDREAIFTAPDKTENSMYMFGVDITHLFSDHIEFVGNGFYRENQTDSFNGDLSEFLECELDGGVFLLDGLEEDDLILNDSREVLKTINAMKRNMDETYYDIY